MIFDVCWGYGVMFLGDSVGCFGLFTLAFDSSPIKGEGILLVVLAWSPSPLIPLPSRERGWRLFCLDHPRL